MNIKACAKINLCLDVRGRRPDGYHEVTMVMQSLRLADEISITPREDGEIRMTMEPAMDTVPVDEGNLMVRAALLLKESCGCAAGADLHLVKRIPAQAGLGGGSADAAAVLKGMNELFHLGLDDHALRELGVRLGADVPFCILGGTALAGGIGEILTPLVPAEEVRSLYVLLVKPREGISTAEMYRALDTAEYPVHPDTSAYIRALQTGDLPGIRRLTDNSFRSVTEKKIPLIGRIRRDLMDLGAAAACMSGSGPTVFGLFTGEASMEEAARRMKAAEYAEGLSDVICTAFA